MSPASWLRTRSSGLGGSRFAMNAARILMAAVLLAGVASAAEPERQFQRAASLHKRVQQYVVHDAHRIRIDDVRVVDGTGAAAVAGQSLLVVDGKITRIGAGSSLAGEEADVVIAGKG